MFSILNVIFGNALRCQKMRKALFAVIPILRCQLSLSLESGGYSWLLGCWIQAKNS